MPKYEDLIAELKLKKDDRGPLDLTRQIGELQCEAEGFKKNIADLEHDNKALAKEVSDLTESIKKLKDVLDNTSKK